MSKISCVTRKLSQIAKITTGSTPSTGDETNFSDEGVCWVKPDNLRGLNGVSQVKQKISAKGMLSMSMVRKGSVLVNCIGDVGKIGVADIDLVTNQQINSISFNNSLVDDRYGAYMILASEDEVKSEANSVVVPILNKGNQSNIKYTFPESVELQKSIATYLDRKVGVIDKIITTKNHTHTHLLELRQAIITDAVLGRGSVVMRRRLKTVVDMIISKRFAQSGDRIVTLENVDSWNGRIVRYADHESVSGELLEFKKGDVVFNKLRPYLAKVFFAREAGLCTSEMLILRPKTNIINPEYLFYFMLADRTISEINNSTYGVKMPRTNWEFVGSIYIDIPSLQEQQNIVVKVGGLLSKIDDSINELQRSTELLAEYRSSLISNVISGKVEV